jgi:hypothetical protein
MGGNDLSRDTCSGYMLASTRSDCYRELACCMSTSYLEERNRQVSDNIEITRSLTDSDSFMELLR